MSVNEPYFMTGNKDSKLGRFERYDCKGRNYLINYCAYSVDDNAVLLTAINW